MDFEVIAVDTAKNVQEQLDYILRLNISPEDKKIRINTLAQLVGSVYFTQAYSAVAGALDSTAISSSGPVDLQDRSGRMAEKLVRNYSLGRTNNDRIIKSFFDTELGYAQDEAFNNAVSMERHPTMVRTLGPKKDCDWCIDKAATYTRPSGEDFARHEGCDCVIRVSGYNTRNGIVNNFVKGR